jgi:hypothetical protein
MKVIPPSAFVTMPWKNGGGVTHEILKEERDSQLLWRLSIAEVASDGPFSHFPGLSRILTVIEGDGLVLITETRKLLALPLVPTAFSGDWSIEGRRIAGDVRDFNVIYDADRVSACVTVQDGLSHVAGADETCFFLALESGVANGRHFAPRSLLMPQGPTDIHGLCLRVALKEH